MSHPATYLAQALLLASAALAAPAPAPAHPDLARCYAAGRLVLDFKTAQSTGAHAVVSAPPGWKVVSGGADARPSGSPGMYVTASFPEVGAYGAPTAWRASADPADSASRGVVEASAVLLYDPDNVWDVAVVTANASGPGDLAATATLPRSYTLLGAGARAVHADGAGAFMSAVTIRDRSVRAAVPGCDARAAHVTAYAIGARRAGHAVHTRLEGGTARRDGDSAQGQVAALLSGRGYAVTAVGAAVTGGDACAGFIDALRPNVFGEEGVASAWFGESAPMDGALEMTALMVEHPAIFYE